MKNTRPSIESADYYNPYISAQILKEVAGKVRARTDRTEGKNTDGGDTRSKEPISTKVCLSKDKDYVKINNLVDGSKNE